MSMRELACIDWREGWLPHEHTHHLLSSKVAYRANCFLRIVGSVRCNNHILQAKQRIRWFPVAQPGRFLLDIIQAGARNPAFFQGAIQRLVINNWSACSIDEKSAFLKTVRRLRS
jgi:hypothetical protein